MSTQRKRARARRQPALYTSCKANTGGRDSNARRFFVVLFQKLLVLRVKVVRGRHLLGKVEHYTATPGGTGMRLEVRCKPFLCLARATYAARG